MKRNDFILIWAVIIIAVACFSLSAKGPADTVKISVDGKLYSEKSLYNNCEINIGDTNTVVIENGQVYMKSANCPDKLCINQGKISDNSEKIICLPNRVIVEVTKDSHIDTVVK